MAVGDWRRQVSVHGRRLGITTTGGIVDGSSHIALMANATGTYMNNLFRSAVETISSSGAACVNYGLSILSSASATARNFMVLAPITAIEKRIFLMSSASVVTMDTSATTILFRSSAGDTTGVTFTAAAGTSFEHVTLVGLSTTRWGVVAKSVGMA